jgi:hypothetical protein
MWWLGLICVMTAPGLGARTAVADAFSEYGLTGSFSLPAAGVFDVLADGRLVTLDGAAVYTEDALGSRTFGLLGTLPDADMPDPQVAGPAFIRVSPNGTRIAVGNNGGVSWSNFQVGVFSLSGLTGDWFGTEHYEAEWIDDTHVAMTAGGGGPPSIVTALDTSSSPGSPTNPIVVNNIGGYSAGITFDPAGNLYTGNAFDADGPSDTGWIKAFAASDWMAALTGGAPADFEASGTLIVDLLSAAALGFDAEGNLHVGGGDLFGSSGDYGYAGLVRSTAVADALGGGGPADPYDPLEVRKFDPTGVSTYDVNYNGVTGELYLRAGGTVYTYEVPEPGALLLILAGALALPLRRALPRTDRPSGTGVPRHAV